MPRFKDAGPDAKQRLLHTGKGYQQRQIYRDNLTGLREGTYREVVPEGDETIRKLKVNVRRAANELGINIRYGETEQGSLLVWKEPPRERTGRRGRPPKVAQASWS